MLCFCILLFPAMLCYLLWWYVSLFPYLKTVFFEFVLSTLRMLRSVGRPTVWSIVYIIMHEKTVHNLSYSFAIIITITLLND